MSIRGTIENGVVKLPPGAPWPDGTKVRVEKVAPAFPTKGKAADGKLEWPDFAGRLARHYPMPVAGPTATELLARDKEDRF